jgi:hypothetical protein
VLTYAKPSFSRSGRGVVFKVLILMQEVSHFLGLDLNIDLVSRAVPAVPASSCLRS